MGRIERGGGDGGEPARSPPGRPRFRRLRDHACGCDICRRAEGWRGSARLFRHTSDQILKWLRTADIALLSTKAEHR